MSNSGRPRDIEDRAFRFACDVVRFSESLMRRGGVGALIARQLAAGAMSVGANLEEAVAAQSRADFIAKTFVSLKESRESHYWLRLAETALSPAPPEAESLKQEAWELVAILTAIAKNARNSARER